jgi:hypothetical protein
MAKAPRSNAVAFCLVAVSMELGLRNKLFGLLLVLHSSSLAGAGSMRAPVHAASLARDKQKEVEMSVVLYVDT